MAIGCLGVERRGERTQPFLVVVEPVRETVTVQNRVNSRSMSGVLEHGTQPPPPQAPPPNAVVHAENTISHSAALLGASPLLLETTLGSMGMLLRDPAYVAGINKAKELRQEGIFSEEDFMQEKELLARQSRERLAAAQTAASAQEEFRTHPGAPGWREYTQADGSSYFYHTDTKIVQWAVPQGVPDSVGLCVAWFSRCCPENAF